jgi:hypothetical protein
MAREPYFRHPTVLAVAQVLVDGQYVREGGTDLLRRCVRIRLEVTGDGDHARVHKALLSDGCVPDSDGKLVADVVRAVRDAAEQDGAE